MLDQQEIALVARQAGGLVGFDVEEHLLGVRGDDIQRTVAHPYLRTARRGNSLLILKIFLARISWWRQDRRALGDNRFQQFHRRFPG